jgi:hypothetical protein
VTDARFVSRDELASWRRKLPRGWQRAVSTPRRQRRRSSPVEMAGEDAAAFALPELKPLPPGVTYEKVLGHLLNGAKRSRQDFRLAVAQLRKNSPNLIAHLSDEEAAVELEKQYRRAIDAAIRKVYQESGRGHELTIEIGA